MEKKQTALQQFIEAITKSGIVIINQTLIDSCLKMEKQQIIDAYNQKICLHLDKEFVSGVFGGYWCPKCKKNVDSELEQD
jgi:hypothetical protein